VQPQLVATLEYLVRCSVPGIRLCAVALAEALLPSVSLELITRRLLPSLTTLLYGADEEVRQPSPTPAPAAAPAVPAAAAALGCRSRS
jgi:hypothetical protein